MLLKCRLGEGRRGAFGTGLVLCKFSAKPFPVVLSSRFPFSFWVKVTLPRLMSSRKTGTICAARGCHNSWQKRRLFLEQECFDHRPLSRTECGCTAPYDLHPPPKSEGALRLWNQALGLQKPPKRPYVCSFHFVDRRPTEDHPYPEKWLGSRDSTRDGSAGEDGKRKKKEQRTFLCTKRQSESKTRGSTVKINVGIMQQTCGLLKPVRGKTLLLHVQRYWSSQQLLEAATKKQREVNQDLEDGPYIMLYPDGSEINSIPGTDKSFTIQRYKERVGKAYQRITLYICKLQEFLDCHENTSSSEVEVQVQMTSEHGPISNTLLWESPGQSSAPSTEKTDRLLRPSQSLNEQGRTHVRAQGSVMPDLDQSDTSSSSEFAPIVIDSGSDSEGVNEETENKREPVKIYSAGGRTAEDILSELSARIIRTSCSRFIVNRANVWEGAVRGFRRASYDPARDIVVKFTEDKRQRKHAVHRGDPNREFLTLLMACLKTRRIFEGPENRRFLTFDPDAAREDEYFMAGRMIAVCLVHRGPGPRFLSEKLYHYLAGKGIPAFSSTVEDISDEQMRPSLLEIANAQTLDELRSSVDRHSSLLQIAGCFRDPESLEEKHSIIQDFMRWYIIYRNHFSIQRFRDGLSTLGVIHALEEHTSTFRPIMCYSEIRLSSASLEAIFEVQLSAEGSSQRQEENRVLGYWRDYLLSTEEQDTNTSLEEILMFATGLNTLPPSGIQPQPTLLFEGASRFPVANTSSNTLRIPFSKTYDQFKADMDFGIQNSPAFGHH
ncbi:uncharacterized protein [Hoplias malabaricus]|uniref:uncharacterized protein isoform X2 n=1 Tax=Hoplias malabaricus TaxID=27720 RepID=UPI003462AAE6